MDILNSDWLIKMLEKSSEKPHARLLALFDILSDWLALPNVHAQIPTQDFAKTNHKNLQNYLAIQAEKAGAAMPEILANQLYFMAISAINDALKTEQTKQDKAFSPSFTHAKSAANALILAQTQKEFRIKKSAAYAIAASFLGVLAVTASVFLYQVESAKSPQNALASDVQPTLLSVATIANPEETAALIAQINLMRKGSCQLPEALQLPDSYKKVYFENIVSGQISTNPAEQILVRELLQKVRCNYTPMLMANSTG